MISIPRSLARSLRAVIKRTFSGPLRSNVFVRLTATPGELVVQAASADATVEYRAAADLEPGSVEFPLELLGQCEGRHGDQVTFTADNTGRVTAHWEDRGIPQQASGEPAPKKLPEFPPRPAELIANEPGLLRALAEAGASTDPNSSRYALGCINLRGTSGMIAATDGKQLLVQEGFSFPWPGEVLVPACKVFSCPELPQDGPISVGQAGDWVAFAVGPWTIWLRINKEGRFPKVDDMICRTGAARSRLLIAPEDAAFALDSVARLPNCENSGAITLDLNGEVLIRAQADATSPPAELCLERSTLTGEPIRLVTDRRFVERALRMGLTELEFQSADSMIQAHGGSRHFVWMPFDAKSALPPHPGARRISSLDVSKSRIPRTALPANRPRVTAQAEQPAPAVVPIPPGEPMPKVSPATQVADTAHSPIEQAIAARETLRDALKMSNQLVSMLKRQRKQSRLVESTLASLKQLQAAG